MKFNLLTKILSGYLFVIMLIGLVGMISLYQFVNLTNLVTYFSQTIANKVKTTNEIRADVLSMRTAVEKYIYLNKEEDKKAVADQVIRLNRLLQHTKNQMQGFEQTQQIKLIESKIQSYIEKFDKVTIRIKALKENQNDLFNYAKKIESDLHKLVLNHTQMPMLLDISINALKKFVSARLEVQGFLLDLKPDHLQQATQILNTIINDIESKQQGDFEHIIFAVEEYRDTFEGIASVIFKMNDEINSTILPIAPDIAALTVEVSDSCWKETDESQKKVITELTYMKIFIIFVVLLTSLVGIVMGFFLSHRIIQPIKRVVLFAKSVSEGDLSEQLDISSHDEIGQMTKALNDMVTAQRQLIKLSNLSNLLMPIMEIDKSFTVTYVNKAGADAMGLPVEHCIGKKCHELFQTEDCMTDRCGCAIAMKEKLNIRSETRLSFNHRLDIPVSYISIPIKEKGDVVGALEVFIEQTEVYNIVDQIKHITRELTQSSEELASTAIEMKTATENVSLLAEKSYFRMEKMAQSGEQMSKNISNEATAIEEMTATLKKVAQNTSRASHISKDADSKSEEINLKMQTLAKASNQIDKVIASIKGIADQTDLLALNAAIEAEGAGTAGKGFAVVADEVQILAKQSAKATEEISQQIEDIQKSTKDAIIATDEITTIIHEIASINQEIAHAVKDQTDAAAEISRTVAQTASGSITVAKVAREACQMVNEMSSYTRKTAARADHTNVSSYRLSKIATHLNEIVNKFKL